MLEFPSLSPTAEQSSHAVDRDGDSPLEVALATDDPLNRSPSRTRLNRWLRVCLGGLVTGGLFAYIVVWHVPIQEITNALFQAKPGWIVLAMVITVGNRFVIARKWQILLFTVGVRESLWRLTMTLFTSYFAGKLFPGTLGTDIMRTWFVSRTHGQSFAVVTSVIVDRVTGLLSLVTLCVVVLCLFDFGFPGRWTLVLSALGVGTAVIAATLLAGPIERSLVTWIPRSPSICRKPLVGMVRVLESIRQYRTSYAVLFRAVGWGIGVQAMRSIETYVIFLALGQEGLFWECLAFVPVTLFVGMVPLGISRMAIGAGVTVWLFGMLGVPASASLLASLLSDTLALLIIPIGAVCYWAGGVKGDRKTT